MSKRKSAEPVFIDPSTIDQVSPDSHLKNRTTRTSPRLNQSINRLAIATTKIKKAKEFYIIDKPANKMTCTLCNKKLAIANNGTCYTQHLDGYHKNVPYEKNDKPTEPVQRSAKAMLVLQPYGHDHPKKKALDRVTAEYVFNLFYY
jgi:hypothetical protein